MGTLLDLASLVTIPSGYKEDKLYSVKPTDGSGDLDFTRSNDTATRVNSAGLVEKVRTNLLTYSQDFSNAAWNKSAGATLTHSQTDPNGGTTASRLQLPSSTSNYLNNVISGVTNGGKYTHSIYMKSNTGSTQSVRILDGVRGVAGGAFTASVTTSWQRFEVVITTASTSAGIQIDNKGGAYDNDILVAFAQTEESDFGATDYIPTTSAAVSVGMTANVPRLDYSGGGCPKLLLEPQRTNLLSYSEQFDSWTLIGGGSVTSNTSISPDGYANADTIEPLGYARRLFTMAGGSNTFSIYLKAKDTNCVVRIGFLGAGDSSLIDVQETITTSQWKRVTLTYTNATAPLGVYFNIQSGDNDVYVWGAQVEAGSYATSYINTLAAAVTRGADACSKTGISSLIGQTEGTLFVEMKDLTYRGSADRIIGISDGTKQNRVILLTGQTSDTLRAIVTTGNVLQTSTFAAATFGNVKLALAYSSAGGVVYANGSQVLSFGAISVPTCSALYIQMVEDGTLLPADGKNTQSLLFKTRLTNTQLAELTTL